MYETSENDFLNLLIISISDLCYRSNIPYRQQDTNLPFCTTRYYVQEKITTLDNPESPTNLSKRLGSIGEPLGFLREVEIGPAEVEGRDPAEPSLVTLLGF